MRSSIFVSLILFFLLLINPLGAGSEAPQGRVVKDVTAEGACAIVGMSAEQCQLAALQRARVSAIEKAAGVMVASDTIVTNYRVAVDLIRAYARGLIVNETVEWLPLAQYQKDKSTPPIPEYRVRITAEVYKPVKKIKPLGLSARLNTAIFRNGEKAVITIGAGRRTRIAIFNITADDKALMVLPNTYQRGTEVPERGPLVFPAPGAGTDIEMQALPGHSRDVEAFFVIAADVSLAKEPAAYFSSRPMTLSDFFQKYSAIADYCEDAVLAYEVVSEQ